MSNGYLQSASSGVIASGTGLAYGSNVTAGSILVLIGRCNAATDTPTVADSLNGSWIVLPIQAIGVGNAYFMAYYINSSAGACTVTATFTGLLFQIVIGEYTGSGYT